MVVTDHEGARRMVGGRKRDASMSAIDHHAMRVDDFYASPPMAVEALLRVEKFTGAIWEPACGDGAISTVLQDHGYDVVSTDLVERGYGQGRIDFLMEQQALAPNIVTNPPYKNGTDFAEHSCRLAKGKVAFLMRLVWLEGARRKKLFEQTRLKRVWVFSKRIPRMHRAGYTGKTTSSSIAFAWFVWDNSDLSTNPPVIGFL